MARITHPHIVQVSTCAVCSARGTGFFEVCDGANTMVDKICEDCEANPAVLAMLSDPEALCPLCEVC